jgi:hypothetical protein
MANYKAIIKQDGKSEIIEMESTSKKQLIEDIRKNGYSVNSLYVKKSEIFDHIMDHTNCNEWDWKENN